MKLWQSVSQSVGARSSSTLTSSPPATAYQPSPSICCRILDFQSSLSLALSLVCLGVGIYCTGELCIPLLFIVNLISFRTNCLYSLCVHQWCPGLGRTPFPPALLRKGLHPSFRMYQWEFILLFSIHKFFHLLRSTVRGKIGNSRIIPLLLSPKIFIMEGLHNAAFSLHLKISGKETLSFFVRFFCKLLSQSSLSARMMRFGDADSNRNSLETVSDEVKKFYWWKKERGTIKA